MKSKDKIDIEEFSSWACAPNEHWYTYAESYKAGKDGHLNLKRLQVLINGISYRVIRSTMLDVETIYRGMDSRSAVNAYNSAFEKI